MALASKMYCTFMSFFVITKTPYHHTEPKLDSNLAIAKICMVYGRLHELSLSKLRINYILVASFFKPLLSFVPKAIFIIYTPTFFLFVRFGKSSSIQLRESYLFVVNRGLKTSCIRRKKNFNQNPGFPQYSQKKVLTISAVCLCSVTASC